MGARIVGLDRLDACLAIRRAVFIEGQGVPEDLEVDGLDPDCVHALVDVGGQAVGTARLRPTGDGGKVERVAVLPAFRGRRLGRALMHALVDEARRRGFVELRLHAQAHVVDWYTAQGWIAYGDRFMEADIPHRAMRLPLTSAG